MTLDEWLKSTSTKEAPFGERVGVSQQTINRYRKGTAFPGPGVMPEIVKATGGKVQPEDFYASSSSRGAKRNRKPADEAAA